MAQGPPPPATTPIIVQLARINVTPRIFRPAPFNQSTPAAAPRTHNVPRRRPHHANHHDCVLVVYMIDSSVQRHPQACKQKWRVCMLLHELEQSPTVHIQFNCNAAQWVKFCISELSISSAITMLPCVMVCLLERFSISKCAFLDEWSLWWIDVNFCEDTNLVYWKF